VAVRPTRAEPDGLLASPGAERNDVAAIEGEVAALIDDDELWRYQAHDPTSIVEFSDWRDLR
jgi:hypothetical protein